MADSEGITTLLQHAAQGDRQAGDRLFGLVEKDLRAIATAVLAHKAAARLDVSPTMLVNDAFLHLVGTDQISWHPGDRKKFFAFASKRMHELVIQVRRAEAAEKRGRHLTRIVGAEQLIADERGGSLDDLQFLIDLEAALERFDRFGGNDVLAFRLRFFFGCTYPEMAALLGVSVTEAKRAFQRASRWLQSELKLRAPKSRGAEDEGD